MRLIQWDAFGKTLDDFVTRTNSGAIGITTG
jgi:hypothetical protein